MRPALVLALLLAPLTTSVTGRFHAEPWRLVERLQVRLLPPRVVRRLILAQLRPLLGAPLPAPLPWRLLVPLLTPVQPLL